MTVYPLALLLCLGLVDSQIGNTTDAEATKETHKVKQSPTVTASTLENLTMKPSNVTSGLDEDEDTRLEDELRSNVTSGLDEDEDEETRLEDELRSNVTSGSREHAEDLDFLEDQLPSRRCQQLNMHRSSKELCVNLFRSQMQGLSPDHWCNMEKVIGAYNDMTICMEYVAHAFYCFYPNQDSQSLFLSVHSSFFQNCTKEEVALEDAPQWLVVVLTLGPVSLIPVLTYVVVWKSKVQE